jgi:hypothetical protein
MFPHSLKDVRLGQIVWRSQEGRFGPYESIPRDPSNEWLFVLVESVKDEKGYAFDQDGIYKYKIGTNGNWLNRYRKSKNDWAIQAQGTVNVPSQQQQQQQQQQGTQQQVYPAGVSGVIANLTPTKDTPEIQEAKITSSLRTEAWNKAHQENMESEEKTRSVLGELTRAILVLSGEIAKDRIVRTSAMNQESIPDTQELEKLSREEIDSREELERRRFGE